MYNTIMKWIQLCLVFKLWCLSNFLPHKLQRKFCENFYGVLTHPSTRIELRTCKQKLDETFQEYYCRFAELRAQVYGITEREVIEHFSNGIKYKW